MNIPSKTEKLLNEQFYNELYAAHIYFAMSAYFRHTPFQGMAKWMQLQSKEEIGHAMKIYEYLIERGSKFVAGTIEKPAKSDFSSPLDAFRTAYEHEKLVTSQLTKIYETANEESDWVSADFLSWFLKEQVEEEQNTFAFVRGLEYAGDDKNLLIGVDSWAGKRTE